MYLDLGRSRLKSLKGVWQWIDIPAVFLAYFCVICYLTVFRFSYLLLIYLLISSLCFIWHNGGPACFRLCLILLAFVSICLTIRLKEVADFARDLPVTEITPRLDTIQVKGDQISFRGRSHGQTYQVYYQAKTEQEQQYFTKLDKSIRLTISASVEKAETNRNFKGFNYQNYLKTQNIYRVVTVDSISQIRETGKWDIGRVRRKATLFCQTMFPDPMASYMTGLLFGHLGASFDEMRASYSNLGILHLFSLSGMQVSFFIHLLRKKLLRLGIRRDWVIGMQLPLSYIYAGLSGFSVSVVRALLQKMLTHLGVRSVDNFSLTLLILFVMMPKFLLTTGGALSVFFAFVISMLGGSFASLPSYQRKISTALTLTGAILPVLLLSFYSFQPFSILLTGVLGGLFAAVLVPGLFLLFILVLITGIVIKEFNYLFVYMEVLLRWLENLIPRPLILGQPSPVIFLGMLIMTGILIDSWRHRKIRYLLIVSLFFMSMSTKFPLTESITIVDIGQGDSILLQDRLNQQTVLIDTGGKVDFIKQQKWQERQTRPNAASTLIPYLKSRGISQLDSLVITHTDADHVGDLMVLLSEIKVKKIMVSEGSMTNPKFVARLSQTKSDIQVAQVGDRLKLFDSYLEVIYPLTQGDGKNNDSIVLYGTFFQTAFLFTGDLEAAGEAALLANYPTLKVDVLKVGHHGSKTSSSDAFIKKIRPTIGLISCGKNNRYQHPNQETLDVFKKYQVQVYRTDLQGAIMFEKKGKSWHIRTVK
ncbi:DNA internalization-related competence protein ComEC/Rec2 [Lactococcus piscium]|nr:DNA internalization-related competence protein ComEC/Rec2 [Lactococcus carnosus]MCJ2002803.1 DNA internalization-related competence protein ComEC/Rec2 [Lactococcus carnosus]